MISCNSGKKSFPNDDRIIVAAYYLPNYHTDDPRNIITKGAGWSEWELVKASKPRFPGHHQPNVPLWGYADEKDPVVMSQKIEAASDNGIDCFIFDWYMYEDGPRIMNINCWNEWTEGSYLEPDTVNGMAYLEAIKSVFKR